MELLNGCFAAIRSTNLGRLPRASRMTVMWHYVLMIAGIICASRRQMTRLKSVSPPRFYSRTHYERET